MQDGTPYYETLIQNKGNFNDTVTYRDFPINAYEHGAINHFTPHQIFLNLKVKYDGAFLRENKTLAINGCDFAIDNPDNDLTFTVNPNSNVWYPIVIQGEGGRFITGNHTTLNFSYGQAIKITNKAKINSEGTLFTTNSDWWEGIILNEPGNSYIKNNCRFNRTHYAINSLNSLWNHLEINNNTFNLNPVGIDLITGISISQAHFINISNNHFNLPNDPEGFSCGLAIYNGATSEEENNSSPGFDRIGITGNDFHFGGKHIDVCGYSDQLLNVYINNNTFEDGSINMELSNVCGYISENIINSSIEYDGNKRCIKMNTSSPDFLNNDFTSNNNNIELWESSHPNFAPVMTSGGQYFWKAGINKLKSRNGFNILIARDYYRGYFYTEHGHNLFNISDNLYHFYGFMDVSDDDYKARENCWKIFDNIAIPQYWLQNTDLEDMNVSYDPIFCDIWNEQIVDRIILDMGNGHTDTLLITQSNNYPQPTEDIFLYGNGVKDQIFKNYTAAILCFKNLINNYPNSKYLEKTIFNLYECYLSNDTSRTQYWRNIIFGDLKVFLENKIQQYENNEEFVNLALEFYLKSSIKKKEYLLAMDGYEFIAENSPSATQRLMASINYIDVEGLLQGSGGGQEDNYENELSSDRNGKPIKDILLASYKNTKKSNEKREKADLQNSFDVVQTKELQQKKHKQEKVLENRALENISISSGLTKKERRERIQKDLMLLSQRSETSEKIVKKNNIEPLKYELSQNYPNPFNPITNIKYQIQKTGLVTLKIYDITGREIRTLVNEIKNPGSYIVSFNGTEFASGVYFYRIQAGDFVQVKKMILVK